MTYLAMCYGSWARGKSVDEARQKLRKMDGRQARVKTVVYETEDATVEVDHYGFILTEPGMPAKKIHVFENGKEVLPS